MLLVSVETCMVCGIVVQDFDLFKSHFKYVHKEKFSAKFRSVTCDKSFSKLQRIRLYLQRTNHNILLKKQSAS